MIVSLSFLTFSLTRGLKAVAKYGIRYCIVYTVSLLYLLVLRSIRKRRFDLYDVFARDDPEKMAFFVPKEEWALETPHDSNFLKQNSDGVRCFGVNSKSEFLAVSIHRKLPSRLHCSLHLRLANGRTYVLPDEHVVQRDTGELHTFGSARMKLECHMPMRKWRIFFNGLMWEKSEKTDPKLKHVKFSFIWVSSSSVFDYNFDLPASQLSHVAAVQNYDARPFRFIEKLIEVLSGYSQSGMFIGQVEVEGESPEEVYLWGYRSRVMGQISEIEDGRSEELFINVENGTLILVRMLNVPGILPEYHYGHVMQGNGHIHSIERFQVNQEENSILITCADGETYKICITSEDEGYNFQNPYHGETLLKSFKAQVNGMPAYGISSAGTLVKGYEKTPSELQTHVINKSSEFIGNIKNGMTLRIRDHFCKNADLSGGKGSSLAMLHSFSQTENKVLQNIGGFQVPKGIVVTTAAYDKFASGSLKKTLCHFEKEVCTTDSENYSALCESVMKEIIEAPIPNSVVESLKKDLYKEFGSDFSDIKFAVRSSATGEDTEQLSAAGQMDTYLGIKGFEEILKAVQKCWASQFGFVAVQYKRRYGQLLNSPMAVVVQEMVPCDVAGVLFTCDPVSGNPAYITISANYGLGESVVSASSEPDTIVLKRNLEDKVAIYSKRMGSKKTKIVMSETEGVHEEDLGDEESSNCCLEDDAAIKLAELSIEIEKYYGTPRDIEWGIHGKQIYLLQSRPITSISIETDFEIKHTDDSYIRREDEYTTKANIGEVFFGSTSPLSVDVMQKIMFVSFPRFRHMRGIFTEAISAPPYFPNGITSIYGHCVFIVADAVFRYSESKGGKTSDFTKAMSVGIFGRVFEDEKLLKIAVDRHKSTSQKSLITTLAIPLMMFFAGYRNRRVRKQIANVRIPAKATDSAEDIFNAIALHYHNFDIASVSHIECTYSSSFWNLAILILFAKQEGSWDNNVFSDFAYLLSTCSDVESAEVPTGIQHLAFLISHSINPSEFKKMSTQDALNWLLTTSSQVGEEFKKFLSSHGHRGIKEFDVQSKTWHLDPKPLVDMLQNMVSDDAKEPTVKRIPSTSEIISNFHVKLPFLSRLWLHFLLPNCQRGVRERENSKSVFMQQMHKMREAFILLGKAMVREGRLPNQELIFFLNVEQIRLLLKTRSPRLVSLAFRRWKCHPELNKLMFPEIMVGIPRPINMDKDISDARSDLTMTGVPVSQGVVTARACVILSVQEAPTIQVGDVLITYATDIGWSPYFPLLSGVVTELGGLVSHGAVVAREYGLPCVVNLHGATRLFKTGDLVLLDGNEGTLKRLKASNDLAQE